MKLKKNWLYIFIVSFAIIGMFLIFISGFVSLGETLEDDYLIQGSILLVLFGIWMLIHLMAVVTFQCKLDMKISLEIKWVRWLEVLFVGVILVLAAGVRIQVIGQLPEAYLQEDKNYYEIAQALMDDSIQQYGSRYCDSIAAMPTIMGYSYLLMLAFKIFDTGVRAGQYFNIFFMLAAAFLSYKIVRKTRGRIAGIAALILCAFWPSRVLASAVISPESAFLFLILLSIWLFLSLVMDYDGDTPDGMQAVLLYLVLGALLAMTAAVSAITVIVLLVMILFLLPQRMKLPAQPKNDIPLMVRALERGWMRCIMILIPYIVLTGVISSKIELSIDRDISPMEIACGSSLWEEVKDSLETSRSVGGMEQLAERSVNFFENEDDGIENCRELLEEQGELTREKNNWINRIGFINQIVCVGAVFFSLVGLFYFLYKEADPAFLLPLIFLGVTVISFFIEMQKEYSFLIPQIFILLSAMALGYIFEEKRSKAGKEQKEREFLIKKAELEEYKLQLIAQEEEKLAELRREAYANLFDMEKALKEGHVIMTVSQAYENEVGNDVRDETARDETVRDETVRDETVKDEAVRDEIVEDEMAREEIVESEITKEPAGSVERMQTNDFNEDDFDWHFTEEELNSPVDKNWALGTILENYEEQ